MRLRWWPRTARWQMLAALVLLEALSILLFAVLLIHRQSLEIRDRTIKRLANQATSLAVQCSEALQQERPGYVGLSVELAGVGPGVSIAKVTDPDGAILFTSRGDTRKMHLNAAELAQMPILKRDQLRVFTQDDGRLEGAAPIYTGGDLRGFAWIENNPAGAYEQRALVMRSTLVFAVIWILASAILVLLLFRAISGPLATLHRGTRALMNSPDSSSGFPLPVTVHNEFGDLIEAFNGMVASIAEQREGLKDTLSLLDSMLANAPIGLAFFDREGRFVRVNEVFAAVTGFPVSRHLGRTLDELLPEPVAGQLKQAIDQAFDIGSPVRDVELNGEAGPDSHPVTWLVNAYPVRTTPNQVRWAGVILQDISERKRNEEALRRTEKLAATGRLAASISHEINNPLEAITNLLFLLRNYCDLKEPALNYATMAEHEAKRIAEITQQTLRFYRQTTSPARSDMGELLDSVLNLFHSRIATVGIEVQKRYGDKADLYCFSGEVRQVMANLVGNAIDASAQGGRLIVRARRSRSWKEADVEGVRFTVADTGTGMTPAVRARIFEAFFTTKDATGTGLGLWVSHEIVLKHQGLMRVRSRTAEDGGSSGTVFQLFFPDLPESVVHSGKHAAVTA
ncbi:MAG: PAS domain-containing protein [Acidobacteriota bacterium]|nr:PAS domain-containing protein [Acidobacteriota bacterium]